ncbi:MAG: GAF domain-containing protein, partial [Deltaproteobacteria bacterium]|nr:GAF domain-containing protein [Deltaproteobacteria bacterium]
MAALLRSGQRPAVLLVEDADTGVALALLERMAEGSGADAGSPSVALIAEARDPVRARELARRSDAMLVQLGPLDRSAEAQLVEGVLGRDPGVGFLDDLHRRTGGLPLLTEAVLAALTADRPIERIERGGLNDVDLPGDPEALVLAGLLADISGSSRTLIEAMAVIGRPASLQEISTVAGVDDRERSRETLGQLERRGWLISGQSDRLGLPGFAMRSLRESLGQTRARKLHRAAFELLESRDSADPIALARHAAKAGLKRRARELLRSAADLLEASGDLPGAIEQLALLAQVTSGRAADATRVELARLHRLTGQYEGALGLLDEIDNAEDQLAEQVALERAATLRLSGRADDALELLENLSNSHQQAVSREARALAARTLLDRGDLTAAAEVLGEVEPEVDVELMRSGLLGTAGLIALGLGDLDRADALFTVGLEAAGAAGESRDRARFLALRGMVAHRRAEWRVAAKSYERALELADEVGDRHGAATYAVNLAAALTELDDVGEALASYRDGLSRLRRVGREGELAHAGANYAQLLLRVGDLQAADEASRRAVLAAERSGSETAKALSACVRGDVLLTRGECKDALDALSAAEGFYRAMGSARDVGIVKRHQAEALLALDDSAGAASRLQHAAEASDDTDALELRRVLVELAVAGEGDLAQTLNGLLEALPESGAQRGTVHLKAVVTAARAAKRAGLDRIARETARDAIEILEHVRRLTPALHRPITDALEREMARMASDNESRGSSGFETGSAGTSTALGWERLVRINTRLNSELRIGALLDLIMDTAIDIASAERGFLLVADRKGKLRIRCARNIDRERLDRDERDYSKSVAMRAFESGEPIVTTDAQEDEQFRGAHSVLALDLRYILAVPLNVQGKATG